MQGIWGGLHINAAAVVLTEPISGPPKWISQHSESTEHWRQSRLLTHPLDSNRTSSTLLSLFQIFIQTQQGKHCCLASCMYLNC